MALPAIVTSINPADPSNLDAYLNQINANAVNGAVGNSGQVGTGIVGASANVNVTACGTATTTQTLQTYTIPANAMDAVPRGFKVRAWGKNGSSAGNKTELLTVGGATISSVATTQTGSIWFLELEYRKTGANAQTYWGKGQSGATIITPVQGTDTSVDTNTISIAVTCVSASGSQSDVICDGLVVEHLQ